MAITQADGFVAVFDVDGEEQTLPVIVWDSSGGNGVHGMVNQTDIEELLGERFNYGTNSALHNHALVSPQPYREFRRYRKE